MKSITFEPSICKSDDPETPAPFSGHVTVRRPGIVERCELQEAYALEIGGADPGGQESGEDAKFRRAITCFAARQVPRFLQAVSLRRVADGAEFTTWDDLDTEPELGSVVVEALFKLVANERAEGNGAGASS